MCNVQRRKLVSMLAIVFLSISLSYSQRMSDSSYVFNFKDSSSYGFTGLHDTTANCTFHYSSGERGLSDLIATRLCGTHL